MDVIEHITYVYVAPTLTSTLAPGTVTQTTSTTSTSTSTVVPPDVSTTLSYSTTITSTTSTTLDPVVTTVSTTSTAIVSATTTVYAACATGNLFGSRLPSGFPDAGNYIDNVSTSTCPYLRL